MFASVVRMSHLDRASRGYVGVLRDVGPERHVKQQLLRAENLSAIGQLIGGVAHELNNPLGVVLGYSELALSEDDVTSQRREVLDSIRDNALRCQRIVRNLLDFARHYKEEMVVADVCQPMTAVVELLKYQYRVENIALRLEVPADCPLLLMDPHKLRQVFLNLVQNAHDAIRAGGRGSFITVRARAETDFVTMEVEDDGPGMTPEVCARVFDPFFTTKPPGQGTGLGLAICSGIAEEHGATLAVETSPGVGTVFRMRVPVRVTAATVAPGAQPKSNGVRGARILVIDDDAEQISVMTRHLRRAGHAPEAALGGRAGCERLAAGTVYDLVICDFQMPDLRASEVLRFVETNRPELRHRFLLATGDTARQEVALFVEHSGVAVLPKPYRQDELLGAVDAVLSKVLV